MPASPSPQPAKRLFRAGEIYRVPKAWGEEQWIVNKEYCGKKLILKKNHRCSMHQHKEKDEVFYVQSGTVLMELGGETFTLGPGDSVHVPQNTPHRFTGLEPSEIMEFSTTHKEEDSYRTEVSGHIEPKRFEEEKAIIEKFKNAKILVVGDCMLDLYLHGSVDRMSPEAPVPVVRYVSENARAGGAANVAANIASLKGKATLISVTGKDESGQTLREILKAQGVRAILQTDASRCTTQKTRIVGSHQQQMLRFDREDTHPVSPQIQKKLLSTLRKELAKHDALLLSDYAKGLFTGNFLQACIRLGKEKGKPVLLDPKPLGPDYLSQAKGATLLFPNKREAHILSSSQKTDAASLATDLAKKTATNVLVTAGEEGMVLIEGGKKTSLPALAHSIVDVSGAGDTVAATVALAIAAGATLPTAADLGNRAASVVVTKPGTALLSREELLDVL